MKIEEVEINLVSAGETFKLSDGELVYVAGWRLIVNKGCRRRPNNCSTASML
jgi:hypothetical protein